MKHKSAIRRAYERMFGGSLRVVPKRPPERPRQEVIKGRKRHPRPLKEVPVELPPTITHDELVTLLEDKGFLGVPTGRAPSGRISAVFQSIFEEVYGSPELSPELIRRLPDRAQGAFQSAMGTGDNLTRWLCVQLAHALFEKDRYKIDYAEASVEAFNLEEKLGQYKKDNARLVRRNRELDDTIPWKESEIRFTQGIEDEPDPCDGCSVKAGPSPCPIDCEHLEQQDPCYKCTVRTGIDQGCPPDCEVLKEIDGM